MLPTDQPTDGSTWWIIQSRVRDKEAREYMKDKNDWITLSDRVYGAERKLDIVMH